MKKIKLTQGKVAIVSDVDYNYINKFKWFTFSPRKNIYYAARTQGGKLILMHRIIANTPADLHTDHINKNGLDNRRSNLRACTFTQNMQNKNIYSNNTCGYKGVVKVGKRWLAKITYNKKRISIGRFDSPEEAAKAYNNKAKELFGHYASVNKLY